MIRNNHDLVHAKDGGNGYHGWCRHCGVSLETDLGWSSWDNLKCIDHEITCWIDIPNEIISYANFRNLNWDKDQKKFTRPYSEDTFTIDEIDNIIKELKPIV